MKPNLNLQIPQAKFYLKYYYSFSVINKLI